MMNALLVWPVAARRTVAAFRSTFQPALALITLAVAHQTWAAIEPSPANDGYATAWELVGDLGEVEQDYTAVFPGTDTWSDFADQEQGLWFKWTAPVDGWLHLDTDGSVFVPTLALFFGSEADQLAPVALKQGDLFADVAAGHRYHLRVSRVQAAAGLLHLNWKFVPRPEITSAPVPVVVAAGEDIGFSVQAAGEAPLHYQWYHAGVRLDGATAATLSLSAVTAEQAGEYGVRVSNAGGFVDVPVTTLSGAGLGPLISAQPQSTTARVGDDVELTVAAIGEGAVSYQWRRHGFDIVGATTATLTLADVGLHDSTYYDVVVRDDHGEQVS